jgi:UDP-N-acetylglucosamine 2-epimerase
MPEEINRLVADKLSDVHFCVSQVAVRQLAIEGFCDSVHWVGDVMFDAMLANRELAYQRSTILTRLGLKKGEYSLVTIHRAANTDSSERLSNIVNILNRLREKVIFPVHPRTKAALNKVNANFKDHVILIDPVGYYDMMVLEHNARLIGTDSGGVQREAYFASIPCVTLRDETEWTETVETGWNKLVGVEVEQAVEAWNHFSLPSAHPTIFGDGKASLKISSLLTAIK